MKFLIKLFSFSFLICSVLYVFSNTADASTARRKQSPISILVVGLDSSPANTDVLGVVSYAPPSNTVSAIQIPRDTYIRYGEQKGKINGLYSRFVAAGASHAEALSKLSDTVSEALGVQIDGYVAFNSEGFIEAVDFLGGVDINASDLPQVLNFKESSNGKIHFDGREAFDLVRYRKEYLRGDLERLDVQKVFIRALCQKLKEQREIFSLLRFLSTNENIFSSFNDSFYASVLIENMFRIRAADIQMATLPGKAVKYNNVWYYTVSRREAEALMNGYFPDSHKAFDPGNYFININ